MRSDSKKGICMFMIALMLFIPIETVFSLTITNVNVQDVSDRYAIVHWDTDVASTSVVNYGFNGTLDRTKTVGAFTTNHTILIAPLDNSSDYSFNVTSVNGSNTATSGPSNFTTLSEDTVPPFINVELPEYYASTTLTVSGSTEPDSQIYVYVNGNLSSAGFMVTESDGLFVLYGIRLQAGEGAFPNTVTIASIDPSGNRNEISKIVNVDRSPPAITFDQPIPTGIPTNSLVVTGNSNEPAVMDVCVGGCLNPSWKTTVNISSPWDVTIPFAKDGSYSIQFYAVDRAQNLFDQSYTLIVDTTPLEITSNVDDLNPSYVLHRTIIGKTKPNANVIVFVNNQTTSQAAQLTQTGITNVPLSAREIFDRISRGQPLTGDLNYVTTADSTGAYSVEVQLETTYSLTTTEIDTINSVQNIKIEADSAWKNEIRVVAADAVGNVKEIAGNIYYTRCGAGGSYFAISAPVPTPNSVPESALRAGFAQFTLTMDVNWQGPVDASKVVVTKSPVISRQAGISMQDRLGRYNMSWNLFKGANIYPINFAPEDKQLFALVDLDKLPANYQLQGGPNNTAAAFRNTIELPLMVEMEYNYPVSDTEKRTVLQRKCIDVSLTIDPTYNRVLDINNFLKYMTEKLDGIVNFIDKQLLPFTRQAQQLTMYGCAVMWMTKYFWYEPVMRFNCLKVDTKTGQADQAVKNAVAIDKDGKASCNDPGSKLSTQQKNCCNSIASNFNFEADFVASTCDRIFCPTVPSIQKQGRTYADFVTKKGDSKCSGGPSDNCQGEYTLAHKWNIVIDWPFNSEYDMAGRAYNTSLGKPVSTGFFETVIPTLTSSFDASCAAQPPNREIIVPLEIPDPTGKTSAKGYMVYSADKDLGGRVNRVVEILYGDVKLVPASLVKEGSNESLTVPEIGKSFTVKSTTGGQGTTETQFTPAIGPLNFSIDGKCTDVKCSSVTGLENGFFPPKVKEAIQAMPSADVVYNPLSGLISATKAVCITGINQYLITYRNMMVLASNCFKKIMQTGSGNAGQCNAFISNVVCEFVIAALKCAANALNNAAKLGPLGGEWKDVGDVMRAFSLSGESLASSFTNRYGETAAFNNMFNQDALLHQVCVAAFTGDWNIDFLNNMFAQMTSVPIESTCVIYPAERRFLGSNPVNFGKPTYQYHVAAMLAAGSDISNFKVQLVCSVDQSCYKYPDALNPGGTCDCAGRGEQVRNLKMTRTSLAQSEIYDDEFYENIKDQDYRYDKARILYTYKDNTGKVVEKTCATVDLGDAGLVPSVCKWGTSGFRCEFRIGDKGIAKFIEKPTAPVENGLPKQFTVGDTITIPSKIEVASPKNDAGETTPKTKYVRYVVKNKNDAAIFTYDKILDEGINNIISLPDLKVEKKHFTQQSANPVTPDKINANNIDIVSTSWSATSNTRFVVTFEADGTGYYCNDVNVDKDLNVIITKKSTLNQIKSGNEVTCNGVSFKLNDLTGIKSSENYLTDGTPNANWKKLGGTAFYIIFNSQAATGCTAAQEEWHVEISLHYSTQQDTSDSNNPSNDRIGSVIVADNKEVKEVIPINASCMKSTAAPTAGQEINILKAELDQTQFDKNSDNTYSFKLTWRFSASATYDKLAIKVTDTNNKNIALINDNVIKKDSNTYVPLSSKAQEGSEQVTIKSAELIPNDFIVKLVVLDKNNELLGSDTLNNRIKIKST